MVCTHTSHVRSSYPFRLKGGEETKDIPVVQGWNPIHSRYEMCDEGLAPTPTAIRKIRKEV